jgi:hypothetical protein
MFSMITYVRKHDQTGDGTRDCQRISYTGVHNPFWRGVKTAYLVSVIQYFGRIWECQSLQ